MALVAASEQTILLASADKGKEKVLFSESEPQSRNFDENSTPSAPHANEIQLDPREPSLPPRPPRLPHLRTIPPFIAEHDIPRGILFALQMFLGYLLMLAVM